MTATDSPLALRLRAQRDAAKQQAQDANSQVASATNGQSGAVASAAAAPAPPPATEPPSETPRPPSSPEVASATSQVRQTEETHTDEPRIEAESAKSQVATPERRIQGVVVMGTDQLELEAMHARCKRLGIKMRGSLYFSHITRAGWRLLHDLADDDAFRAAMETGRPPRR